MTLAQVIGCGGPSHAFARGDEVGASDRGMSSIEVGGLRFHVADVLFSR